jgi:hypothetical protein
MITLKPGTNMPVFTLNEKFDFFSPPVGTYPDLYFCFKITNDLTQDVIYFTSDQDQSLSPQRYNQFMVNVETGTASVDPHIAVIGLTGPNNDSLSQWQYQVWACSGPMPLTGTISLPEGGTYSPALVESGRMLFSYQL